MRFGAVYASVFTVVLLGAALLVAIWKLGDGSRDPANDAAPAALAVAASATWTGLHG